MCITLHLSALNSTCQSIRSPLLRRSSRDHRPSCRSLSSCSNPRNSGNYLVKRCWTLSSRQTSFFIIEIPKSDYLTRKHAFWAINGRDRSSGVTCRREQEYKKDRQIDRTQKVMENALPTQTPFPSSHINQILHVGSYPGYLSWLQVLLRSVEKMWKLWGVEISTFPLTWHIAYRPTTYTAQAVINHI